ncbi:MAG: hypothetical protein ACM3XM_08620 [Mycobacterium leprae]
MTELNKRTIYGLLREIRKLAMHASMTHSMQGGSRVLVETYNRCLSALTEQGDTLVTSLFTPLSPETTKMDEVGAAAALLAGYVRPEDTRYRHDDDEDDDD